LKLSAYFNTKVGENLKCKYLVLLHRFHVCSMYFVKPRTGTVHKTDMNTNQFVPVSHTGCFTTCGRHFRRWFPRSL